MTMTNHLLNNVPVAVYKATLQTMRMRPNTFEIELWRKTVTRTTPDGGAGGDNLPTIGGMGQLSGEDEPEYNVAAIGEGIMFFVGPFQGMALTNSGEAMAGGDVQATEAVIVPVALPNETGHFEVKRQDVVMLKYDMGVVIPFMVVDILTGMNIPTFSRRYVLNKLDDLLYVNDELTNAETP